MRTLDLFCGAGLGSAGARAAGAKIVAAIDFASVATQTFAKNFPGTRVINDDLKNIDPLRLREEIGEVELLIASPECTNHTCAKGSAPRSEESRETALHVVRFAKAFKPRWIVMENVVHMKPWSRYDELLADLRGLGYQISEQIHDASKFGVPQKRRRLFIVCDRQAPPKKVQPPSTKVRNVTQILDREGVWKTTPLYKKNRASDTKARARRAIAALGKTTPFLIVYYGTDGGGGWQSLDRPLRTVTTVDRFALVRPTSDGYQMRMLQVTELQRAMGLDETFVLNAGTRREKIKLLGNGICPPVMKAIVESLSAAS